MISVIYITDNSPTDDTALSHVGTDLIHAWIQHGGTSECSLSQLTVQSQS